MDMPSSSPPTKSTNDPTPDDSRHGYGGCYTCGAIVPCATMKTIAIVYAGSVLRTPGYDCAACASVSPYVNCVDCGHRADSHAVDPLMADSNDPPWPCGVYDCACSNLVADE